MKSVTYVGFGDARILAPADLVRYGVETDQTFEFGKNVAQQMEDDIAGALSQDSDFQVTEVEAVAEEVINEGESSDEVATETTPDESAEE